MRRQPEQQLDELCDDELVQRTRAGDARAFKELWSRHSVAGLVVARTQTATFDADDIVSEAFTRVYTAIAKGGGPRTGFRAYLFTTIRNVAASWGRANRETATEDIEDRSSGDSSEDLALRNLERDVVVKAFRSLPERWQEALWYSEIEQMSRAEMAHIFGIKPSAVGALTMRAREGLREAWIQGHLESTPAGEECRWVCEHLGAYSQHKTTAPHSKRIAAHLKSCQDCAAAFDETKNPGKWLAVALLPLIIGITAANLYLESAGDGASAATVPAVAETSQPRRSPRTRPTGRTLGIVVSAVVVIAAAAIDFSILPRAATPVLSASPATTTLTASLDLGPSDRYYPIAAGAAPAGATVTIWQDGRAIVTATADDAGRWSTAQLDVAEAGTLTISTGKGRHIHAVSRAYGMSRPSVSSATTPEGLTITATGEPGATLRITTSPSTETTGRAALTVVLTLNGNGIGTLSTRQLGTAPSIQARYEDGARHGSTVHDRPPRVGH